MDVEKIRLLREKLRQLEIELGEPFKPTHDCCGLTLSQCHTLLEIGKKGEVSLVELASTFGLDTSTLSRTIHGLVLIGLADRLPSKKDRRYVSISLTEQGKKVYDEIENVFNGFFVKIFQLIPKVKHDSVFESIILFADAVKKYQETNRCCQKGGQS